MTRTHVMAFLIGATLMGLIVFCNRPEPEIPDNTQALQDSITELNRIKLEQLNRIVRLQLMTDSIDSIKQIVYIKYRDKKSEIITLPFDSVDQLIKSRIDP